MNRFLSFASFALPTVAGLVAVLWVGAGYAGSYPLALAVTVLIGAFFLVGVAELYRYRQATQTLTGALAGLSEPAPPLADWLSQIDPALRQPVRQRVEGERAGLPAPSLTPSHQCQTQEQPCAQQTTLSWRRHSTIHPTSPDRGDNRLHTRLP